MIERLRIGAALWAASALLLGAGCPRSPAESPPADPLEGGGPARSSSKAAVLEFALAGCHAVSSTETSSTTADLASLGPLAPRSERSVPDRPRSSEGIALCEFAPGATLVAYVSDEPGAARGAKAPGLEGRVQVEAGASARVVELVVSGGRRLQVIPSSDASQLILRAHGDGRRWETTVPLRFTDPSTTADPIRARAIEALGRARRAFATGNTDDALAEAERAAREARAAKVPSLALRADLLRVHVQLVSRHDLAAARSILDGVGSVSPVDGEGAAFVLYYRGVLGAYGADVRSALRALERAELAGQSLGLRIAWQAAVERATILSEAGRAKDALAVFESMEAQLDPSRACDEADLRSNRGWASILARDPELLLGAERDLLRARRLYEESCPRAGASVLETLDVNLAFIAIERGDLSAAERRLAPVMVASVRKVRLWAEVLVARIALDRGRWKEAEATYGRIERDGEESSQELLVWLARVGGARAVEGSGRYRAAAAKYEAAEQQLADRSLFIPVAEGRLALLEDRSASAEGLVRVNLRVGDVRGAFVAARRSRRRALQGMEVVNRIERLSPAQRKRWDAQYAKYHSLRQELDELAAAAWEGSQAARARSEAAQSRLRKQLEASLDDVFSVLELSAAEQSEPIGPREGEVIILPFLLGPASIPSDRSTKASRPAGLGGRWMVFAASSDGAIHHREFDEAPDGAALRSAFRATFAKSSRLRVLDSAAHPIRGLGASADANGRGPSVVVALDLGPVPRVATTANSKAVLVIDPRGDLRAARREGAAVSRALAAGWQVELLSGMAATPEAVRAALRGATLFHFAGHGRFQGTDGFDSALLLADGELAARDILLDATPPRWIVLSGCETSESASGGAAVGLGLAQAFLLAGAEAVVATTERVRDDTAAELAERIAHHLTVGRPAIGAGELASPALPSDLLESAFREARAELVARGADVGAFRLLIR